MRIGDRCRIDIPDENDPDHHFHGAHGEIVDILEDDASDITGDQVDDGLYTVELDETGDEIQVRARDLRPPFNE